MFRFAFQPMGGGGGRLICLLQGATLFIEQAIAIVQQCNDHTDKRCALSSARIAELASGILFISLPS